MNINTELQIEKARDYACQKHQDANHTYGEYWYAYHLEMVVAIANKYIGLLPPGNEIHGMVISACWCHDLIEDARQTYNAVRNEMGMEVAEMVFACTNEKGRFRQDRANDKYYEGIRSMPYADFVKLCDRIANVQHCINTKNKMLEMYQKENPRFVKQLYNKKYEPMFNELEELLNTTN